MDTKIGIAREVALKDAKAGLSGVVDAAIQGTTSIITRHGRPAAVVIGYEDWKRLSNVPSFGRLLMACPLEDGDLPERDASPPRDIEF
jgi:antitoxin Phd